MIYTSRKAVLASLAEFTGTVRARHCIVRLASGRGYVRTLGHPTSTAETTVHHVRGREWIQTYTDLGRTLASVIL